MEQRRPTNKEWMEIIRPLMKKFDSRSARKRLIRLHRDPPKTSKIQNFWPTGETVFYTVDGLGIKVVIISPDGGCQYLEYGKDGQRITLEETAPAQGQQ